MKGFFISLLALVLCCTSVSAQQTKRQMIKKLNSLYTLIDEYYVEDMPLEPLVEEAIRATLRTLDPHSQYLTKEEMEASKRRLSGKDATHCPVVAFRMDSIGYISISAFTKNIANEFYTAYTKLGDVKSIVIDLRNNGGGYLTAAIDLSSLFLSKGDIVVTTESKRREVVHKAKRDGVLRDIPLVVILNENSASASEIFAGAMQDHDRGVIVGRTSYGKGLIQKNIEYKDGSGVRITTARYKTPSGRPIQRPYTKGMCDVYLLDSSRFTHPQSITRDSALIYKTLKHNREVYAGGGIIPDVYIDVDNIRLSTKVLESLSNAIIEQSVAEFCNSISLDSILENYPTVQSFREGYALNSELLDMLYQRVDFASDDITATEHRYIEALLCASLAERLYGIEARYIIYISMFDFTAQCAVSIAASSDRISSILEE